MGADRGYDADKTLAYVTERLGALATIPPKESRAVQRDCDSAAYRERHLVECPIGKLKHFRRLATRHDKYGSRYLAFVHRASIPIWLK